MEDLGTLIAWQAVHGTSDLSWHDRLTNKIKWVPDHWAWDRSITNHTDMIGYGMTSYFFLCEQPMFLRGIGQTPALKFGPSFFSGMIWVKSHVHAHATQITKLRDSSGELLDTATTPPRSPVFCSMGVLVLSNSALFHTFLAAHPALACHVCCSAADEVLAGKNSCSGIRVGPNTSKH